MNKSNYNPLYDLAKMVGIVLVIGWGLVIIGC